MSNILRTRQRAAIRFWMARSNGFAGHPRPLPRLKDMGGVKSRYYVPVPAGKTTAVRGPKQQRADHSAWPAFTLLDMLNGLFRRAA